MSAEMDLDFDGPSKAPARQARFAPKSSKLKPKPEPKPKPETETETLPAKKEEPELEPSLAQVENDDVPIAPNDAAKVEDEAVTMEIDTDEDEIVREIDVFFTPSLDPNTKLYVLQYPLRPVWRPYDLEERCKEVRLKPSTTEMEVDLAIDFDSKNYDGDSVHAARMKTQTLSTSWVPLQNSTAGYAVGVLIGDKLHLNPIHAVVQMRPSLQHLKESELKKSNATSNDVKAVENEEVKENKPNKPPGNDEDTGENWVQLRYLGARSNISARYLHKMAVEEGSQLSFSMPPVEYLNALCPRRPTDTDRLRHLRARVSQLPLEDRFRTWLLEGPPIHRFGVLKHLARGNTVDEILGVLQKYAQLVQGLWVPKSSLLYGADDGVEAVARNFVLFEFSKSPFIKQSVFDRKPEFLKAATPALKALAVERPYLNDWKFKEHPDKKYERLYGDVVKEQQANWQRLGETFSAHLHGGRNRPPIKNPLNPNGNIPAVPSGGKPAITSLSRTSTADETLGALPKAVQKLLRIHKVCSLQQIRQRLRDQAVFDSNGQNRSAKVVRAAADVVDAPPEELQALINQVAVNIHGAYVLRSSPDNPQYDALRKVVIDLFIAGGPSAKLKKASIVEAARLQMNRDITNAEFQKVMQELCVSQNSAWVLRSGDGNPT